MPTFSLKRAIFSIISSRKKLLQTSSLISTMSTRSVLACSSKKARSSPSSEATRSGDDFFKSSKISFFILTRLQPLPNKFNNHVADEGGDHGDEKIGRSKNVFDRPHQASSVPSRAFIFSHPEIGIKK